LSIYRLFSKPGAAPDGAPSDQDLVCLAERFNWFAFLLPPLWAASHGLWRQFILMFAALALFVAAGNFFALPVFSLYFVFALWLGFEASSIHARSLMRRGWRQEMDLIAPDQELAESRFWRHQIPINNQQ